MRSLVILNPAAGGRGDPASLRDRIGEHVEADFALTAAPGDATGIATDAARSGYDLVIAVGGDGTVREVVAGLHRGGGGPRLGIIPAGTGNDLAFSLGIPPDIGRAAAIAVGGRTASLDLVHARSELPGGDERILANAAVAGFCGRISDSMSPGFRRRLRPVAYPLAAIGQVRDLRSYSVRLEVDGRVVESKAFMVVVANSRYAGGRLRLAPDASTADGLLDVVVIHATGPLSLAALVPSVLLGRHASRPDVSVHRASAVRISARPPMWINLDGDTWQCGPATLRVLRGALSVAVA